MIVPAFLFADLVGFTAYTEAHGDEAAADLAASFSEHVDRANAGHGAVDVKTMGDGCMVYVPDAACAASLGVEIVEAVGPDRGLPDVRVGIDAGPAVQRGDDWFGMTVNRAARLVDRAAVGTVLITDAARALAVCGSDIEFKSEGNLRLRGLSTDVEVYRAARTSATDGGTAARGLA